MSIQLAAILFTLALVLGAREHRRSQRRRRAQARDC